MAAGIFGFATFNSTAAFAQRLLFERSLRETELATPPLFILGHWRSGTTHLHDLLDLDPRLVCPNTYQCFAPHHFLLTEWMVTRTLWFLVPAKRPMDNVAAGWRRPQEDEFALCNMGQPSPYRWLAFPESGPVYMDFLDFKEVDEQALQHWTEALIWFARCLTYRHPQQRVTFKSPTHTGRIAHLARTFPGAKFIHLTRNPYELFASTVRLWDALEATQSLQKAAVRDRTEYVLECFERMYAGFQTQRMEVPESQLVEVRYEDLTRQPMAELQRVYEGLELDDFEQLRPALESYLQQDREYQPNRHSALDDRTQQLIQERCADYLQRYGYNGPGSHA